MAKKKGNNLDLTANILVVIGAINWGLTELGYNVVDMIFGSVGWLASLVYYVVGIAGLYVGYKLFK